MTYEPNLRDLLEGYSVVGRITNGPFANSFEATHEESAARVRLRRFVGDFFEDILPDVEREVGLVAGVNHPGWIGVYSSGQAPDGAYVIATEMPIGPSLELIQANISGGCLAPIHVACIAVQVADAVAYLHARTGNGHAKIATNIICVDSAGRVALDGLGTSAIAEGLRREEEQHCVLGRPVWGLYLRMGQTPTARDWFRVGLVLTKLLTREDPFLKPAPLPDDADAEMLRGWFRARVERIPEPLLEVIVGLLAPEAERRYDADWFRASLGWATEPHVRRELGEISVTVAAQIASQEARELEQARLAAQVPKALASRLQAIMGARYGDDAIVAEFKRLKAIVELRGR